MYEHKHHNHDTSGGKALATALVLTLSFALIEFLTGWWAGSLALMADAGHMLTDSTALALAATAAWIATRPADRRRTWGHGRIEIVAALINGVVMVGLVGLIAWHAIERFQQPREVQGLMVMVVAAIGLGINVLVYRILSRGQRNLNVRGAMLHVLGDLLGSIAALSSGAIILLTGWMPIDPILSLFICVLILVAALRLLREALGVVMESVPAGLELETVRGEMLQTQGVLDIHDLHVWRVSSERVALSAHVVIVDLNRWPEILAESIRRLSERFGIDHPTLQPELTEPGRCDRQPDSCRD